MAYFSYWPKFLNGLLFVCCSYFASFSQNLVPNPSFEEYFQIPCGRITTQIGIQNYVKNWYTPTFGTSDIWTKSTGRNCTTSLSNDSLAPYDGSMCAGVFLSGFSKFTEANDTIEKNYREYIQVKLNQPLKKGKIYRVEFYVMLYYTSSFACNNMGMLFSMDSLVNYKAPGLMLRQNPQVVEKKILTDTKKWQRINGCFQAEDAYRYLTIGNFMSHEQTAFKPVIYNTSIGPYYLVDKVIVEEVDVPFLVADNILGPDTTLCEGQQLHLQLDRVAPYKFLWNDGSAQSDFRIKQAGKYTLQLSYAGCNLSDTIEVSFLRNVNLGADLEVCNGMESPLLTSMGESLLWQDNTVSSTFNAITSGVYSAHSLSLQCPSSDTVVVAYFDCPSTIPTVFTPNNDGINDLFVIDNIAIIPWELEVYNRWGKRVYFHPRYDNTWNGSGLDTGTYYYQLSNESVSRKLKGWVQILK